MPSWKTLEAETTGAGVKNVDDAFNSFLAIPAAGFKNIVNKYRLTSQGSLVAMWVKDEKKNSLTILDNRVGGGDMTPLQFVHNSNPANGFSVRCVKD
jgi:hypothetical protein